MKLGSTLQIIKQPVRRAIALGAGVLAYFSLASPLKADNIMGKVESVPSLTAPKKAKITFTNTSSGTPYIASIDSLTGAFSTDVPAGTYERKIEADNNFVVNDTINVAGSTTMNDLQTIEDIGKTSSNYSSILEILKTLINARDSDPGHTLIRWSDSNIPIKVYPRNYNPSDSLSMPDSLRTCFDDAMNDLVNKSNNKVKFTEISSPDTVGISFVYLKNNQMPTPGVLGWTEIDSYYPDFSPKHVTISINREVVTPSVGGPFVFRREFGRSTGTTDNCNDPNYIMSYNSTATSYSADEGKSYSIYYTLHNQTNMFHHKNSVYNGVEGQPTTQINPFKTFAITSTYPNPARSNLNIEYKLAGNENKQVTLKTYNMLGIIHFEVQL